ncbi:MAG: efflux RND transporter periplasmic adaptor subunit [Xanthobacteraceae bacterium]|nr:efflux RND transporter periplasmic adaptor subunit [Xanthobacteraceae bacterium]
MFPFGFFRAFGGSRFSARVAAAGIAGALLLASSMPGAQAHEGHDHGSGETIAGALAPRVAARSDIFDLVGILRGDRLVIYLDRAATNEPVTTADIAVTIGDAADPVNTEWGADGTYALTSPQFKTAGPIELVFSITGDAGEDLLAGTLTVPGEAAAAPGGSTIGTLRTWLTSLVSPMWQMVLLAIATAGLALYGTYFLLRRYFAQATAFALMAVAGGGLLFETARGAGSDPAVRPAASGATIIDSPRRQPDGHAFVPKPTQRLLDVRTEQLAPQTAQRAVSLIGRIIADPNSTSLVQSINGGRVMAPDGGLPRIGQAVRKGDLLARIEPTLPQADRTTILEKLGEVEQLIAVAEARLRRIRALVEKAVAPQSQLVDAEAEMEGLRKRRQVLLEIRVEPEALRAQTSGVIAAARVVPGQVVQAQDVLFQVVDPKSLWVEALVYGEIDPAGLGHATATVSGRPPLKLRFQGFSHALQQHASIVQFVVEDPPPNLGIGLPVNVIATSGEPVTALIVPKDAVVRSANGEAILWRHEAPELFEPRPVRTAPFDATRVIIAAGAAKGDRVVIRASDLVNQVR